MKKSFLVALASFLTLGLSSSIEAYYYSPYGYGYGYDTVIITPSPFYYTRPVYYEMDPKAALFSSGVSASIVSFVLGVCGVAQIAEGLADFANGHISQNNDGAELPRGVCAVSCAALLGAVAVSAFQAAAK